MKINGKEVNIQDLSLPQLQTMERSFDEFLFKDESIEAYEPSYRKDPAQFKKLINTMVSYRRDITKFFAEQYANRENLVRYHLIQMDDYNTYLFDDNWDDYEIYLSQLVAKHNTYGFDLGIVALGLALGLAWDYSAADASKQITDNALKVAQLVNKTTKDRAARAVQASLKLGEDRAALEERLKNVFTNPYRGRFMAQEQTIQMYIEGKDGLARNQDLGYKIALSSQATDQLCAVNGEVTPINKPFSNGFILPKYHFGCKCDVAYARNPDGSN